MSDTLDNLSIIKNDYKDFANYIKNMDLVEAIDGLVPDSTFFALDTDRNIFVGAVNIRHYLNESLLLKIELLFKVVATVFLSLV